MPYTWDGQYIESAADARTDTIGFKEIGGIGQLIYHLFRFQEYDWDTDKGNAVWAYPLCDGNHQPDFAGKDDYTGRDILVSLCNLAKKIDDFNETKSPFELIMEWCRNVAHPYNIDFIYNGLTDEGFDVATDGWTVEKDGRFSVDDFINDLGRLYQAARVYVALENVCLDKESSAYNLYRDGRCFEGLPFFERYKHTAPEVPEGAVPKAEGKDKYALLNEMREETRYMDEHPEEEPPDGEFAQTPYDDYEKLRDTLIDMIPDFRIRLKTDTKTNRLVFSADVNSVFDIAWYTLARMMSEDPALENIGKEEDRPEGIMICCRHCGDFMVRRNSRQEYCNKVECQKARNAKNQHDFRERKRKEKMQGRDNLPKSIYD